MNISNTSNNDRQVKSTAAQAGPSRKAGAKRPDERNFVLPLFKLAGSKGINRLDFLQGKGLLAGRLVTQIGRLVNTLEKEGYIFKHVKRDDSPFIYYVLAAEPTQPGHPMPAPAPKHERRGWRAENFTYGKQEQAAPRKEAVPVQGTLSLDIITTINNQPFIASETGKLFW